MDKIGYTISSFEEFNGFRISNYVTYEGRSSISNHPIYTDKYIGQNIFKKNIEKWISFFSIKDQSIYLDLLKRYHYYTEEKINDALWKMAEEIKKDCKLENYDDIFFITFASKEGKASGGDSLRAYLRITLPLCKDNSLLDTSPNLPDICHKAKAIVFLDDLAGTGMTMYGRIRNLILQLNLSQFSDIKLYAAFICANKKKLKKKLKEIKKNFGITIIPIVDKYLEKELSIKKIPSEEDYKHINEVIQKYDSIIYENKLSEDEEEKCIKGFCDSQLLLTFCYDTPNNTIAAFWRPSKKSTPLFIRSTYKTRLSVNDLKKGRYQSRKNHYYARTMS